MSKHFTDKIILIVGASSGIGAATAKKLTQAGAQVIITARRQERLELVASAAGPNCQAIAADALDAQQAEQLVQRVVQQHGRLDMILLNAGGAPALDMRDMTAADVNAYMRSNYDVTVNYLFPALAVMKQQGHGTVAHTNSLAGFLGVPLQGPYSAAKGAARLLIDTCRLEFAEFGIKFCQVYPGFVATEATQDDGMQAPLEISEDRAAEYILYALRKGKADYMFPAVMRWVMRLAFVLPKGIVEWVLKRDVPVYKG